TYKQNAPPMSEYQYYEFVALDRPLTDKQIDAVRQFSTRAEITSTRFTNEYHWGDFKGDPHEFLRKWYDAMVYYANWGSRQFMFRAPADLVDLELAAACCAGDSATMVRAGENVIFDFDFQIDDGGDDEWWEEGSP